MPKLWDLGLSHQALSSPYKALGAVCTNTGQTPVFLHLKDLFQRRRHFSRAAAKGLLNPVTALGSPAGGFTNNALPSAREGASRSVSVCDGTLFSLNCPTPGLTHTERGHTAATVLSSGSSWGQRPWVPESPGSRGAVGCNSYSRLSTPWQDDKSY